MGRHKYDPPTLAMVSKSLKDRVEEFLAYWDKFFPYTQNFLDGLFVDKEGFASIVAASTISPIRQIQPVTGGATVNTILARGEEMSPLTLLAIDGFPTGTSGNISAAVTLAAGTGRSLYWNPATDKWMPA